MSRFRPLTVLALAFVLGLSAAVGFGLFARVTDSEATAAVSR